MSKWTKMNKPTINQQNSTDVNSYVCYYERVKTGSIEKYSAKGCSDATLDQFGRLQLESDQTHTDTHQNPRQWQANRHDIVIAIVFFQGALRPIDCIVGISQLRIYVYHY